jgi:hypothetical protein
VVLYGETGRGKTFAVQRFYDKLIALRPGYWSPGLAPPWPPISVRAVRHGRKQVEAILDGAPTLESPPFFWIGAGASPTEGAFDVDMGVVIGEQIARAFSSTVARADRRRGVAREAVALALDAIGVLVPPVGLAKTAVTHTNIVRQLATPDGDWLSERRAAIYAAYSTSARAEGKQTPMIVVLDDAPNAGFETLFLLPGLIAPDAEFEPDADTAEPERFLPSALTVTSPGPLLIVCTAWEHRMRGAFTDPFQRWLQEVDHLGLSVTWEPCGEIRREIAQNLLRGWDSSVPTQDILTHIVHDDELVESDFRTSDMDHAAAERVLWVTVAARENGDHRDAASVGRDIWRSRTCFASDKGPLTASMWRWTDDATSRGFGPPMTPMAAASKRESLWAFGGASRSLIDATVSRLRSLADADDGLRKTLDEHAEFSAVATATMKLAP